MLSRLKYAKTLSSTLYRSRYFTSSKKSSQENHRDSKDYQEKLKDIQNTQNQSDQSNQGMKYAMILGGLGVVGTGIYIAYKRKRRAIKEIINEEQKEPVKIEEDTKIKEEPETDYKDENSLSISEPKETTQEDTEEIPNYEHVNKLSYEERKELALKIQKEIEDFPKGLSIYIKPEDFPKLKITPDNVLHFEVYEAIGQFSFKEHIEGIKQNILKDLIINKQIYHEYSKEIV